MQPKHVALIALEFLVLASLLVVFITFWSGVVRAPSSAARALPTNTSEAEQALRAKLEDYNKRAEDLQKMVSLLLGLTTIYTIVLGVAAYATLQNNLSQADKAIQRLDNEIKTNLEHANKAITRLEADVRDNVQRANAVINRLEQGVKESQRSAETAITRLDDLRKQHEELMEKTRVEFPQALDKVRQTTTYFGRIALATAISQFPIAEDDYQNAQKGVINGLLDLRNGEYSTDRAVNQQLARLYKAVGNLRSAEEVMTSLIERKQQLSQWDDETIVDAYYDRACYRALRWPKANAKEKDELIKGVTGDLSRAFSLDADCKVLARSEPWLRAVANEDWFKELVQD